MSWFFNKWVCFFFEIIGIAINIANSLLTNIIVFEATEGISFNWEALFSNRLFWWVTASQLLYGVASICVNYKHKKSDQRLKKAIEDHEILLLGQVVNYTGRGDFDSATKVIGILDKFEERRNK